MKYSASLPAAAVDALKGADAGSAPRTDAAQDSMAPTQQSGMVRREGGEEARDSSSTGQNMWGAVHGPEPSTGSQARAPDEQQHGNGSSDHYGLAWRARLTGSLDRLRALTAQPQPRQQQAGHAAPHASQHAEPPNTQPASSTLQALASTASRYLPIYVHFGSQHQLHALHEVVAQPPISSDAEAEEGADILAALQQEQEQEHDVDAAHGQYGSPAAEQHPDDDHTAASSSSISSSSPAGNGAAAATRRARLLSHHRMYAIRERAAEACAAAAALDGLPRHAQAATPVQLRDDVAPQLIVAAAMARLPPLPPRLDTAPDGLPSQQPGGFGSFCTALHNDLLGITIAT